MCSFFRSSSLISAASTPIQNSERWSLDLYTISTITSAIALSLLLLGGVALSIVAIYFVPKAFFVPLIATGSSVALLSLFLLTTLVIATICKKRKLPIQTAPQSRNISLNQDPIEPAIPSTESGLPGNFLPGLNNICWANTALQALCIFDHDLKAYMQSSEVDEDLPFVNNVRKIVAKLDARLQVSAEEMRELMHSINSPRPWYITGAGVEFLGVEVILDHYLHSVLRENPLINIPDICKSSMCCVNTRCYLERPKTLTEAFQIFLETQKDGRPPEKEIVIEPLPKTLIFKDISDLNRNDKKFISSWRDLSPEEDGFYHIRIKNQGQEILYKYRLIGTIAFVNSNHLVFRKATPDNKSYLVYNDARINEKPGPLLLKTDVEYAFFEMVGRPITTSLI